MSAFFKWWYETGSGIVPLPNNDHEEHAERVSRAAWEAASDQLRKERDEARREICVLQVLYSRFYNVGEESECAKDREWDCFKEKT
jgi:hypothetical protein